MKSTAFRMICRFLIASLLVVSFGTANAGMIGVDQSTASSAGQSDRAALIGLVNRSEVARELNAHGIDPQMARERIAAMTDPEVQALKGQIDSLPAGASFGPDPGTVVAVIVLVAVVVWFILFKLIG